MSSSALHDRAIYIVCAGAQAPVGRSVLTAAAAVRCGVSAYAEHPFMTDKHGEPMIVARAKWIDDDTPLEHRVAILAVANSPLPPLSHVGHNQRQRPQPLSSIPWYRPART
jgi:hypothetical protein